MPKLRIRTASEQVTDFIRMELGRGAWSGLMPGMNQLAAMLGVGIHTVDEALRQLEKEGLLENQGRRRRRLILAQNVKVKPVMRIRILLYDKKIYPFVHEIRHALEIAGHHTQFADKTLEELGMNLKRVSAFVERTKADAWVVESGSREILEWFSQQKKPVTALFGRFKTLTISGIKPDQPAAIIDATRRLIQLGHRRIIMLARTERRLPEPGTAERSFLSELEANGIKTGAYNLPDWHESAEGLRECLTKLFKHTPPTAIFIQTPDVFIHVLQFCVEHGIKIPRDLSLVSMETDENHSWSHPTIAHFDWNQGALIHHCIEWAQSALQGKISRSQTLIKTHFIDGGTIGPVQ